MCEEDLVRLSQENMWSFGLSCDDARDKHHWDLEFKGHLDNPGLRG